MLICFLFNDPATADIYTYGHPLSRHYALPIFIGQHFGRAVHALQTDNALPCIDRVDPSGTEIDIGRGEQLAEGRRHRRGIAFIEARSEEHKSELQSLMRNSYAVFCLKKKN